MPDVCFGLVQSRAGGESAVGGQLKRGAQGGEEPAHLRNIWHDLTDIDGSLQLAQMRVVLSQLLIKRNKRRDTDRLSASMAASPSSVSK